MYEEAVEGKDYVRVFDTTLRDGEQSPGCTMDVDAKVRIAKRLRALGVDVIEAGFAAAKAGEPEAIRAVVEAVGKEKTSPVILSLARTRRSDIDAALEAVQGAAHPGIHIFIATSNLHLQEKLGMSFEEAVRQMVEAVEYAKQFVPHIEVSAEDATRTPVKKLVKFYRAAILAGATVCNVPDTTGYATVDEYRALFRRLARQARVCRCDKSRPCRHVTWSAHVHDDLGMATAKTVAAVEGGARQVECTIGGIGERAGNTPMEEVVMALDTRYDRYRIRTRVDTTQLYPSCQALALEIGQPIYPTKPIVGGSVFSHEAGIHQDGVLKNVLTYEIMRPERIGRPSNELVLGKHSGSAAVVDRLRMLGIDIAAIDVGEVFNRFKELVGVKREGDGSVDDDELLALIDGIQIEDRFKLRFVFANTALDFARRQPTAHVYMIVDGKVSDAERTGDGIIDAALLAVRDIAQLDAKADCKLRSIGHGPDAMGEAVVTLTRDRLQVRASGAHTDVTMAAVIAYVKAANKLDRLLRFRNGNGNGQVVEEKAP